MRERWPFKHISEFNSTGEWKGFRGSRERGVSVRRIRPNHGGAVSMWGHKITFHALGTTLDFTRSSSHYKLCNKNYSIHLGKKSIMGKILYTWYFKYSETTWPDVMHSTKSWNGMLKLDLFWKQAFKGTLEGSYHIFVLHLFISFVCMWVWVPMPQKGCVCQGVEVKGQPAEGGSLLSELHLPEIQPQN